MLGEAGSDTATNVIVANLNQTTTDLINEEADKEVDKKAAEKKPLDAAAVKALTDQEAKADAEHEAKSEVAGKAKQKANEAQESVNFARKFLQKAQADKELAEKLVQDA